MFYDKDSRGTMSLTDITREDAYTLRRAARLLLRKIENAEHSDKRWLPLGPWYREKVDENAIMARLKNFIQAVNTCFPEVRSQNVAEIKQLGK